MTEGTFKLVCDNESATNLILQVRNSQATKELCEVLLEGGREKQLQRIEKILRLLDVIFTYSSSSRDKVVANALRALGYFLNHADIGMISEAYKG